MEEVPPMSAIDVIRARLDEAGVPTPVVPKQGKPDVVAFVDVNACVACGLCIPHCPAECIETLPAGAVAGRDPQPVQVRHAECVGCHLCVEICAHLTDANAVRTYDANLIEQVLSLEIPEETPAARTTPEPGDENWAEGGGFHHMGEGSCIEGLLSDDDRARLAAEHTGRGAA